jgi:hypothetical protein
MSRHPYADPACYFLKACFLLTNHARYRKKIYYRVVSSVDPVPEKKSRPGGPLVHSVPFESITAIIAGILILAAPKLLNYTIGIYLIVVGILGVIR